MTRAVISSGRVSSGLGSHSPRPSGRPPRRPSSAPRLLLVVGTSAVVYPAAGLVDTAQSGGSAVIEINLESTPISERVDLALQGKAAEILPRLAEMLGSRGPGLL